MKYKIIDKESKEVLRDNTKDEDDFFFVAPNGLIYHFVSYFGCDCGGCSDQSYSYIKEVDQEKYEVVLKE